MMLMMPSSLDPYCWHKHFPSSFAISLGNRQHFAMIDTLLESATEWTTAKGNELNMQPNHFNEFNRLETASNTYRYWHVTHTYVYERWYTFEKRNNNSRQMIDCYNFGCFIAELHEQRRTFLGKLWWLYCGDGGERLRGQLLRQGPTYRIYLPCSSPWQFSEVFCVAETLLGDFGTRLHANMWLKDFIGSGLEGGSVYIWFTTFWGEGIPRIWEGRFPRKYFMRGFIWFENMRNIFIGTYMGMDKHKTE